MRRMLRKVATGDPDYGDTSTLLDPAVLDSIEQKMKSAWNSAHFQIHSSRNFSWTNIFG